MQMQRSTSEARCERTRKNAEVKASECFDHTNTLISGNSSQHALQSPTFEDGDVRRLPSPPARRRVKSIELCKQRTLSESHLWSSCKASHFLCIFSSLSSSLSSFQSQHSQHFSQLPNKKDPSGPSAHSLQGAQVVRHGRQDSSVGGRAVVVVVVAGGTSSQQALQSNTFEDGVVRRLPSPPPRRLPSPPVRRLPSLPARRRVKSIEVCKQRTSSSSQSWSLCSASQSLSMSLSSSSSSSSP